MDTRECAPACVQSDRDLMSQTTPPKKTQSLLLFPCFFPLQFLAHSSTTLPPNFSSSALIFWASSLLIPSLTILGASSTNFFAYEFDRDKF